MSPGQGDAQSIAKRAAIHAVRRRAIHKPLGSDWAGTECVDGYWQGNSLARVVNDRPYDQIHGYTNLNPTLIFPNQDQRHAMADMKNVFNTTTIAGAFLNPDDIGLTTNVFTTDPRLFGLRITKNW